MALTAAEKQKRYRERMRANNPEKFEEAKRKNAARNKDRKKISECTENEKKNLRKQWRNRKNKQKNKLKENNSGDNSNNHTDNKAQLAEKKKFQRHLAIVKTNYETTISNMSKKITALRKKCYRLIKKQESLITCIEEVKAKNAELLINNDPTSTAQDDNEMTPLSKAECFINNNLPNISTPEKQKVKKQLLNYNVLTTALQNTYGNSKNNEDRNVLKSVVENDIVSKYKVKSVTTTVLGLKGRARRRKTILKKNKVIIDGITKFYERDDVSRATAGKNEVKTLKKNKQQRRYLLKSLKDLYKKYKLEGGKAKYTSFKKYRPFYILRPKLANRETCGCIKHENIMMKIEKLKLLDMISTKDLDEVLGKVQCDLNSKECAYGECSNCRNKIFISFNWGSHSRSEIVTYEEFKLDNHEYINKKNNKITVTKKMEKKHISESLETLVEKFKKDLKIIKKHVYNIKHQYYQYSSCIKNLKNNEVAIHIDFSENYTCKYGTEVQSMHFGASKPQITIHTGVLYTSESKPQAFASISPSNEHGPEAIWAHLEPILNHIRSEFPAVTAVHIFSDGPTSQYKQKKNFFLFSKYTKKFEIPYSTWNFSEASHGKGAADGVGGAIKRRFDTYVSQGIDIPNAETAFKILRQSDTSIMTFYISDSDIARYSISDTLTPVPQTMALHQIVNTEMANVIKFRCLSCFCGDMMSPKGYCGCLDLKDHLLIQHKESEKENELNNLPSEKKKAKRTRKMTRLGETTDSETEEIGNRNKIKKTCETGKIKNNTKVTILSDVRYRLENRSFCNKITGNFPLKLKKIEASDILKMTDKTNTASYDNPIPSTSGLCERRNVKTKKFRKTQLMIVSDASSTDNDEYSVHDTSDDDQIFLPDRDSISTCTEDEESRQKKKDMEVKTVESSGVRIHEKVKVNSGNNSKVLYKKTEIMTETEKDYVLPDTKEEEHLNLCDSVIDPGDNTFLICTEKNNSKDIELKTLKKSNNVEFEMTEIVTNTEEDRLPDTEEEKYFSLGDSVLVRYFQRQSWKYYIGFIESVQVDETVRYTIRFLKTIYKPTLKFAPTKRDRDIVPEISVVKKVELELNDKVYVLKDFIGDKIYFNC